MVENLSYPLLLKQGSRAIEVDEQASHSPIPPRRYLDGALNRSHNANRTG